MVSILAVLGPFYIAIAVALTGLAASFAILEVLVPLGCLGLLAAAEVVVTTRHDGDPAASATSWLALTGLVYVFTSPTSKVLSSLVTFVRHIREVLSPAPALTPRWW